MNSHWIDLQSNNDEHFGKFEGFFYINVFMFPPHLHQLECYHFSIHPFNYFIVFFQVEKNSESPKSYIITKLQKSFINVLNLPSTEKRHTFESFDLLYTLSLFPILRPQNFANSLKKFMIYVRKFTFDLIFLKYLWWMMCREFHFVITSVFPNLFSPKLWDFVKKNNF